MEIISNQSMVYINKLIETLDNVIQELPEKFTDEQKIALNDAVTGISSSFTQTVQGPGQEDASIIENAVNYTDVVEDVGADNKVKKIGMRNVSMGVMATGVDKNNITKIASALAGIGSLVQVPLWHSGFWITMRPLGNDDMINIATMINENDKLLARETAGFIYSNHNVIYTRIVTDFLVKYVEDTTLDIDLSKEDIRDYIRVEDLYPWILSIIGAIYPKGYDYSRRCVNVLEVDETGKSKCTYELTGKLDVNALLKVDKSKLTPEMTHHMANRTSRSISIEAYNNYQRLLKSEKKVELTSSADVAIEFTFKAPTVKTMIHSGEKWVMNIIATLEDVFANIDKIGDENNVSEDKIAKAKLSKLTTKLYYKGMASYNHHIASIKYVESGFVAPSDLIDETVGALSEDIALRTEFFKELNAFINSNTFAVVGVPNFVCPKCNKLQNEDTTGLSKDIIPLNLLDIFFNRIEEKLGSI
jgi:hypothetical protein